jgi:hypothetical protein
MKKWANCIKVKVLSKDYIFHVAIFYWFIHFSHSFLNWISNLRPNMTYNMIKIQIVLHWALHYSQIYNFTLNHDHKFKTKIMLKDIRVLKSKNAYLFIYFEFFEHTYPFLWNILRFRIFLKWFGEHLIKEKNFWYKKTTYPHVFLECFKHIKWLLKHGKFSWKFCSCNFEIIKIYFKNKMFF